jgi:hypothetical protein
MNTFERKYVTVSHNAALDAVEICWSGFANEDQYKETIQAALQILIDNHCKNWLADQTYARAVSPKVLGWLKSEIFPKAIEAGARKMAFVVSKDIFNKMFADSVKSYVENEIGGVIAYFQDMESARKWFSNI